MKIRFHLIHWNSGGADACGFHGWGPSLLHVGWARATPEGLTGGAARSWGPPGLAVFNLPLGELLAEGRGTPRRRLPALRGISGEAPAMDGFNTQWRIQPGALRTPRKTRAVDASIMADSGYER